MLRNDGLKLYNLIPEFAEGMKCYDGGDHDAAARLFQKVADECLDVDFAAEAQRWAGFAFREKGDYLESIRRHKRTLDKWPESEEAKQVPVHIDAACFQQLQKGEELYHKKKKELADLI